MAGPVGNHVPDPWALFRFRVEIQGIAERDAALHFSKCGSISVEGPPDHVQAGGRKGPGDQLPPLRWKWSPLLLERGLAKDGVRLWKWIMDTVSNKRIEPHNITITLNDNQGKPGITWTFLTAYPTKWSIPVFDASSNGLAIESISFAYQGVTVQFSGETYEATGLPPPAPPAPPPSPTPTPAKAGGAGAKTNPPKPPSRPSGGNKPAPSGGSGGGSQQSGRERPPLVEQASDSSRATSGNAQGQGSGF